MMSTQHRINTLKYLIRKYCHKQLGNPKFWKSTSIEVQDKLIKLMRERVARLKYIQEKRKK